MKIVRFEAENVKRLRAVAITPTGSVVQITGPNGAGKSSVLDAIYWALAGASGISAQPVHTGEQKAHVRLDLGDLIVTRRFTAGGGTSLVVEAADGARYPSPQTMLDALLGSLTFDPLAFSRMGAREQRAELAKMVGLTGQLDALSKANGHDAEERTAVNRLVKLGAARLDAMPAAEDVEPVDVTALMAEMREATERNAQRQGRLNWRENILNGAQHDRTKAAEARARAAEMRERAERLDAEAQRLEQSASEAEADVAAKPLPDPIDTAPLHQRILEAQAINAAVAKQQERAALAAQVAEQRAQAEALTAAIAAREAEKAALVAGAAMPIEGLGITDDGVTYRGVPFEQASSAEQLRVSVAIAMAANPKLRVLRIKDGSLLDERSLAMLEEMANAADYQVWVERVDTSGAVGIVMEDGAVVADHTGALAVA